MACAYTVQRKTAKSIRALSEILTRDPVFEWAKIVCALNIVTTVICNFNDNKCAAWQKYESKSKKAVPLHAMEALGGRGGIAPTHSRPRHWMWVSGQRHAPAALYPRGKDPRYSLYRRLGGPQSRSGHRG